MKSSIKIIPFILIFTALPSFVKADQTALALTSTVVTLNNETTPATASATSGTVLGIQAPVEPPIITQIKNAKQQLAGVNLNYAISPTYKNVKNKNTGKTTKTLTGHNLWAKDIALAILDPQSGQTIIVKGMQEGKKMTFRDPAAQVKLTYFNGVNSKFSVSKPEGGKVLALKYLITNPETGKKADILSGMYEAIYVPSSPDLADPAVIKYGEEYLNGVIKSVAEDLKNTPSRSFLGKTITEAIRPALIKALVYAEHTDTTTLLSGNSQAIKNSLNNLNVLFAANEGDTYKYSVSSAGARGISQFMPATYKSLAERHKDANLIPDFVAGMNDHKNSIKATYLLLDDYAAAVRQKAASGFAEGRIFDYGAAAYNGGVTRIAKAVNNYGPYWTEYYHGEENSLRNETVNYLKKIYAVIPIFNDQTI